MYQVEKNHRLAYKDLENPDEEEQAQRQLEIQAKTKKPGYKYGNIVMPQNLV